MRSARWTAVARGAAQGAAAWGAYAVVEFVFSSLLYAFTRHYASFTPWHWQLTALLVGTYLVVGALVGAILRGGATLALAVAFALNVALAPVSHNGKYEVLAATAALIVLLAVTLRSDAWRRQTGLLTNAWVVSGLLLGIGQLFGLALLRDSAAQFGSKLWLWTGVLAAALLVLAAGAVFLGRRLQWSNALNWVAGASAALLFAASVALGLAGGGTAEASAAVGSSSRPNVLVIVLDTVRADHLSIYGYPRKTTPRLEELARDSMLYTNAIAPSDMTLTSHASLFTGVYPGWHGAYCDPPGAVYGKPISKQYKTLAEVLSANGYATYGVSANVYLREEFGSQRGFDTFRIPRPVPVLANENWYLLRVGMRRALSYVTDTAQFDRLFARGEDVNRELFGITASRPPRGKPFFVFLNYMDAHYPYVPPAPFDGSFPGKQRRLTQDDMDRNSERVVRGASMPGVDHAHRISQYDGGIRYDDEQVGRVLDWLKRQGAYDNTLIVVTSDHGEAFGQKNLVLHGNSAYQDLLHVALMVKFPGNAHRGVVRGPVSLVDVFPTVMDALGLPVAPGVQGHNLLAAAGGAERTIYGESFPCPVIHPPDCPNGCTARAIFAWPQKYIASSSGKREIYDLSSDPAESRNLYSDSHEAAGTLSGRLNAWLKTVPARSKQTSVVDRDSVNRLKSLGYVQ